MGCSGTLIYLHPNPFENKGTYKCSLFAVYSRGPGVQCVLQFGFRADRYTGVIALQDALTMKNILHSMAVKTHYISSTDGKGQTQTLFCFS